ncbi:hypothetical protein GCK72_017040 [Caenorhabditis remanei]|uniref:Uncharacterized protein n=1 Tax=Caenorhabditis remanei TaxID=31234 RepID=A0A6A5G671_CAERE|nr:hypothetical protein GCK72_017040 [Caenorhabditis remanei]KAF1750490.1 hypothetical protein GCK72_017040 [Caenorhabditis remanei]
MATGMGVECLLGSAHHQHDRFSLLLVLQNVFDTLTTAINHSVKESPFTSPWRPELTDQRAQMESDVWQRVEYSGSVRRKVDERGHRNDTVRMVANQIAMLCRHLRRRVHLNREVVGVPRVNPLPLKPFASVGATFRRSPIVDQPEGVDDDKWPGDCVEHVEGDGEHEHRGEEGDEEEVKSAEGLKTSGERDVHRSPFDSEQVRHLEIWRFFHSKESVRISQNPAEFSLQKVHFPVENSRCTRIPRNFNVLEF